LHLLPEVPDHDPRDSLLGPVLQRRLRAAIVHLLALGLAVEVRGVGLRRAVLAICVLRAAADTPLVQAKVGFQVARVNSPSFHIPTRSALNRRLANDLTHLLLRLFFLLQLLLLLVMFLLPVLPVLRVAALLFPRIMFLLEAALVLLLFLLVIILAVCDVIPQRYLTAETARSWHELVGDLREGNLRHLCNQAVLRSSFGLTCGVTGKGILGRQLLRLYLAAGS